MSITNLQLKKINIFILLALPLLSLFAFQFQADDLAASKARGKETYAEVCMSCHMANGKGVPGAFPPLAGSDYLLKSKENTIKAVKFGLSGEVVVNGEKYNNVMPGQGLSDKEVADVLNYVCNSWGNKGDFISEEKVKEVKEE